MSAKGKLRSASLARTSIDEHATEAKTEYRSEHCRGQHGAGGGTAGAAGQEDGSVCHGQSPER